MRNINIEVKAKFDDHDTIRDTLIQKGAEYIGIDFETDTFFNVRNGSLKLREGNIETKLMFEEGEPEDKNVLLYNTQKNSTLKSILEKTYGIEKVIEMHREIYRIKNVTFYIDYITDEGSFIGIEAIGKDSSHTKEELMAQCKMYIKLLKLKDWKFIKNPYTEMVDQLSKGDKKNAA